MNSQRKLSIYIAEFPNHGEDGQAELRYHTALFLIDEGKPNHEVVQELHFNDHADDMMSELMGIIKIVPNARQGKVTKRSLEGLRLYPVIGGYESSTMPLWNHMLRHAVEVKREGLLFDYQDRHMPHANNCRAGIVSALSSIGIGVQDEYYASDAGTRASRIRVSSVFAFSAETETDLAKLQSENIRLMVQLIPPWEQQGGLSLADLKELRRD